MANKSYLFQCSCGRTTSLKYARSHSGKCKVCAEPDKIEQRERRPQWGSQEWAETRGDDLGLSPDF